MERLANGLDLVNLRAGQVVRWLAVAMVLLQFVIVLLRYVFGFSSVFLGEGVLYLHATIFMLGAGYTLLVGGHVRVDIFYSKLDTRGRALVDVFGHLALLAPGLLVLLYYSWPTVRRAWAIYEGAISVGGIPASFLLKSLIPAFAVLLLIQGVAVLLRDLLRLRGRAE
ncbi:TRAP transporter small permease subunit [Lutibaculum baratangense]|nr:TRAP transporter small permease subunit [Lutibaculum baratangense]